MKRLTVLMLAMALGGLVIGCATQYHCSINPPLNRERRVTAGTRLVEKTVCYGKVSVNDCYDDLWLTFLGKTGGNIRIQSTVGTTSGVVTGGALTGTSDGLAVTRYSAVSKTPIITEILYPESSKLIEFQDVKIEIIEVTDSWITYKLIGISTQGCNKVNGQEVK